MPIAAPVPAHPAPHGAAAGQELLGGRCGAMAPRMNATRQSFNVRGCAPGRPCDDLIANIAAEEYRHSEWVASPINLVVTGTTTRDPHPVAAP